MATKIRLKVGDVEVDFEGPEAFLTKKLPDLISQLSALANQVPASSAGSGGKTKGSKGTTAGNPGTLAAFLKAKKVDRNQTKKFLATAQWLQEKGNDRMKTGDVTAAIRDSHQGRLTNASHCLAKNVEAGNCEKVGREFFVTDDGRATLG